MYYYNYIVEREASCLKITAEKFLDFHYSDSEPVMQGTPKWWDDYVISKIDLNNFKIYFLCTCTVTHGQYNRLTDYKKVWGLHKIEKGFYDNYYENSKGRVYFGIQKVPQQQSLMYIGSSTILLLPKKIELDADKIFNIFKNHKFDFSETKLSECKPFVEVSMIYEGSIILKYNCTNEVSLLLFHKKLDDWFNKDTLISHEGDSETVYRKQ